jgi:hypothetical protein
LLLSELDAGLPDTRLGPQFRGFENENGDVVLIVADAATTACVTGIVGHFAKEEVVIGNAADCYGGASFRPLVTWAPNPLRGEAPTHECIEDAGSAGGFSCEIIDITTDCNSGKGLAREWSTFVIGARRDASIQSGEEAAMQKFLATGQTIADATCVANRVTKKIERQYKSAKRQINRGRWANAAGQLEDLALIVDDNVSAFSSCTINFKGDIQGRACSTAFTIRDLIVGRAPGDTPPPQCAQPAS